MNRSGQKTCACLSSNRKTCQLGAHCIRKKITFNLDIALGLAVRICGFTNKTRVRLPEWEIYKKKLKYFLFPISYYAQLSSLRVL